MSVYFETTNPSALLSAFDAAISLGNQAGGIATWTKVQGYYTHTSAQWGGQAYFQASVTTNRLVFNIVKPTNASVSIETYGYYHGHIIETMLNHFDKMFVTGAATALPTAGDRLT